MFTISKPISAGQAHQYHANEFANAKENYYAEDGQIRGQWHGHLAEQFELSGEVASEHFRRLADGQHPQTGAQLIKSVTPHQFVNARGQTVTRVSHRAGWDATCAAPKTASLVALVGGDTRVREAHRDSVLVALDALQAYTQARTGSSRNPDVTGRWAAALFEHDSARPVKGYAAPQLHTHCVVFNMTQTEAGQAHDKYRALQPRELYRSQAFATAVYRSELARRLTDLGYTVERGSAGQPEIAGFSAAYVEAASPRRQQIQAQLEAGGWGGAAAAEIAQRKTREPKRHRSRLEVLAEHQQMARAFGDQPQRAVAAAAQAQRTGVQPTVETPRQVAEMALTFAIARNIERAAVVEDRSLMTDALRRTLGATSLAAVREAVTARTQDGRLLERAPEPTSAARSFTTPEMVVSLAA